MLVLAVLGVADRRDAIAANLDDHPTHLVQQLALVGRAQQRAVAGAERPVRPYRALDLGRAVPLVFPSFRRIRTVS